MFDASASRPIGWTLEDGGVKPFSFWNPRLAGGSSAPGGPPIARTVAGTIRRLDTDGLTDRGRREPQTWRDARCDSTATLRLGDSVFIPWADTDDADWEGNPLLITIGDDAGETATVHVTSANQHGITVRRVSDRDVIPWGRLGFEEAA